MSKKVTQNRWQLKTFLETALKKLGEWINEFLPEYSTLQSVIMRPTLNC